MIDMLRRWLKRKSVKPEKVELYDIVEVRVKVIVQKSPNCRWRGSYDNYPATDRQMLDIPEGMVPIEARFKAVNRNGTFERLGEPKWDFFKKSVLTGDPYVTVYVKDYAGNWYWEFIEGVFQCQAQRGTLDNIRKRHSLEEIKPKIVKL